jgi:hypothetical protein
MIFGLLAVARLMGVQTSSSVHGHSLPLVIYYVTQLHPLHAETFPPASLKHAIDLSHFWHEGRGLRTGTVPSRLAVSQACMLHFAQNTPSRRSQHN